jgi:hypothetical protein
LCAIAKNVCDDINTPASFLVKHGIYIWYIKNLQEPILKKALYDNSFSEIAKESLKLMIGEYYAFHTSNFNERQKIKDIFGITGKKPLPQNRDK